MAKWVDAHTHLDSDPLFDQKDAVLQRAEAAGVDTLLLVNSECSEESFSRTLKCLHAESSVRKFATFGVHPHHAGQYGPEVKARLFELLKMPGVVGLGEIGLDYYYNYSPPEVQRQVLRSQLLLALELSLPVVIHCRDAYGELAQILKETSSSWRGMIHCFTGAFAEAEPLLELGFAVSFSGIVTFKNAESIRDAARRIPPERVLVETDAPYLAPVPHRGKTNEPAFVADTGRFVAGLRQQDVDEFSILTTQNFHAFFVSQA